MAKLRCAFINENDQQCRGYAIKDSEYCLSHDPDMEEMRIDRARKGGASESYEKLNLNLPPLTITNSSDIVQGLLVLVNEVRTGQIPPRVATTIGYLLGIALKAYEITEVEQKVERIEQVIVERKIGKK